MAVERRRSLSSDEDDDDADAFAIRPADPPQPVVPSFGNISIANSNDVHFGNKTFYQGPVTIKQFLYGNAVATPNINTDDIDEDSSTNIRKNEIVLDCREVANGLDNPIFVPDLKNTKIFHEKEINGTETGRLSVRKGFQWLRKFSKKNMVVLISLLSLLMLSLGILMVILLVRHNPATIIKNPLMTIPSVDTSEQEVNTPVAAPLDPSVNLTLAIKLKLVSRLEWLAQPPSNPLTPLKVPVPYVIISHTATENCSSQAQCVFHVRYIQTFHIESRNWYDIGYNFLVGGDGEAYEGRGWKIEGAHTYGYNAKSIGISFIGTFNNFKPPERQIRACKLLIAKGVELNYIKPDYKVIAARQLATTQSPGAALYEDMKTWDHWAKEL